MSEKKTSIHINGKRYDAITGIAVQAPTHKAPVKPIATTHATPAKSAASSSRSIDGMVSGTKVRPVPTPRKTAAHAKAHAAKPSATLMRAAVVKPAKQSLKRHAKTQSPMVPQHAVPHTVQLAKKLSAHNVNDKRLARAGRVNTSAKISHFTVAKEVTAIEQAIVIPTAPAATHHVRTTITPEPTAHTTTDAIFQRAILRATSHQQPAPKGRGTAKHSKISRGVRRRMATYGAGAIVLLALVGVLGYANAGTIEFKLAANKAGFAATMPGYKPVGYTIDKVSAAAGYVGVDFVADQVSGSQRFALTEKPTDWSEHDVLSNLVIDNGAYQTIEEAGRTVYTYGQHQAAWVSDGVLYQVSADHSLSAQDLGQLAASM